MLEKNTLSRVKYKKTCVDCGGKEIAQIDIVKGFQYEKDKYVIFTEEDFEKLKTEKDKNITIDSFVELKNIDPIYFDKSYYVNPTGGEKAYALLLSAMEKGKKAGIAKTVLGTKEVLLCLRVRDGRMVANTLFFHDEIVKAPQIETQKVADKELALAINLIDTMSSKWQPENYHDEYNVRLKNAIEEKVSGKEITVTKEKRTATIINIMDALTKSIELTKKKVVNK